MKFFRTPVSILLLFMLTSTFVANIQPANGQPIILFKGNALSTGWIPFEFYNDNRIFIPARINGQKTCVTLATGAATSTINKDFAASIGFTPKADGASSVEIQFGNLTLQQVKTTAADLAEFARGIGHPVPFILGDELFNHLVVEIDFANRRIALFKPSVKSIPAGAAEVPLISTSDTRTVPVSLEGAPPAQFAFGLGNAAPLLVYQYYYEAYRLLANRPVSLRQGGGGAGPFPIEPVASLNHVEFAGVGFSKLPAAFIPDSISGVKSTSIAGNVGIALLSRFHLIIDYSNNRLFAIRRAGAENTPFVKDRLGMVLIKKPDGFEVRFVSPGSPAQTAGFKVGDRITLINKKPVKAWPDKAIANLRFLKTNTRLSFKMTGGEVRRVRFDDFF